MAFSRDCRTRTVINCVVLFISQCLYFRTTDSRPRLYTTPEHEECMANPFKFAYRARSAELHPGIF